jgi:hypothetical protein
MAIDKALYQAPMGIDAAAEMEEPIEIEIEDPESVTIGIGGLEIVLEPDEEGDKEKGDKEKGDNVKTFDLVSLDDFQEQKLDEGQTFTLRFDDPYVIDDNFIEYAFNDNAFVSIIVILSLKIGSIKLISLKENKIYCVEVKLKTLGDRNEAPSSAYPSGKYINYHAGPSSTVNLSGDIKDLFLRNNSDDPIYVLNEQIGENAVLKVAEQIYNDLKSEFK